MIYELFVGNTLFQSDVTSVPEVYVHASNTLVQSNTVISNINTQNVSSPILFSHAVSVSRVITNILVGHSLFIQQDGRKQPSSLDVFQGLAMWDRVVRPTWEILNQPIGLSQSLAGSSASKFTQGTITWSDSVDATVIRNLLVGNFYSPRSRVSIITSLGPDHILAVYPPIVDTDKVTFTFGSFTFQVRKPEFDNSTKLEFSRINRKSRAGDLIIFRDEMWPESETLKMRFELLNTTEKNLFTRLFRDSLGRVIQYHDYLGHNWAGIILNPGEPVVQYGIERFRINIELQGGRI